MSHQPPQGSLWGGLQRLRQLTRETIAPPPPSFRNTAARPTSSAGLEQYTDDDDDTSVIARTRPLAPPTMHQGYHPVEAADDNGDGSGPVKPTTGTKDHGGGPTLGSVNTRVPNDSYLGDSTSSRNSTQGFTYRRLHAVSPRPAPAGDTLVETDHAAHQSRGSHGGAVIHHKVLEPAEPSTQPPPASHSPSSSPGVAAASQTAKIKKRSRLAAVRIADAPEPTSESQPSTMRSLKPPSRNAADEAADADHIRIAAEEAAKADRIRIAAEEAAAALQYLRRGCAQNTLITLLQAVGQVVNGGEAKIAHDTSVMRTPSVEELLQAWGRWLLSGGQDGVAPVREEYTKAFEEVIRDCVERLSTPPPYPRATAADVAACSAAEQSIQEAVGRLLLTAFRSRAFFHKDSEEAAVRLAAALRALLRLLHTDEKAAGHECRAHAALSQAWREADQAMLRVLQRNATQCDQGPGGRGDGTDVPPLPPWASLREAVLLPLLDGPCAHAESWGAASGRGDGGFWELAVALEVRDAAVTDAARLDLLACADARSVDAPRAAGGVEGVLRMVSTRMSAATWFQWWWEASAAAVLSTRLLLQLDEAEG